MSAARLQSLKDRLNLYLDCEIAILGGAQSYQIGSRQINRANINWVKEMIQYLENEIKNEEAKLLGKGRNRVIGVIPRDL